MYFTNSQCFSILILRGNLPSPPDRALPASLRQCPLPLACRHPPEGHQTGFRNRRAPGNTLVSQPYRGRVSTDRLNREGSQLAASLEGDPGPTPAGRTLPHSFPEARFRREGHEAVQTICRTRLLCLLINSSSFLYRIRGYFVSYLVISSFYTTLGYVAS